MTAGEVQARMSATELYEWAAYERVCGPIGAERQDFHMSVIASAVANSAGGKRTFKPSDFTPEWDRKPQTWQDQLEIVKQLNRSLKGSVQNGDSD